MILAQYNSPSEQYSPILSGKQVIHKQFTTYINISTETLQRIIFQTGEMQYSECQKLHTGRCNFK